MRSSSVESLRQLRDSIRRSWILPVLVLCVSRTADASAPPDTLIVHEALGISLPRTTISRVVSQVPQDVWSVTCGEHSPREGESVRLPDNTRAKWQRVISDSNGWFPEDETAERIVAVTLNRKSSAVMILEAMGHDIVYVNGVPRAGNPYQQKEERESWEPRDDYSHLPIELNQGQNLLLFRYTRGRLKIRLSTGAKPVTFNGNDLTLPDAVIGNPLDAWGSILIINSSSKPLKGSFLVCSPSGGIPDTTAVPQVPAMSVRKTPFRICSHSRAEGGELPLHLTLLHGGANGRGTVDTITIPLRVIDEVQPRKETFISSIDGSVQYYAVVPPLRSAFSDRPALFLSLHGAGVEALNQAASYSPKNWGYIVAPTNRRPFGFSWEDWGRMDALEVLNLVKKKFDIDEGRIYLTGHSMGGHGTWFMGVTYPDKFAAIGPSAGWITFQSYRFAGAKEETTAVQRMLRRAAAQSDLFSLAENYRHFGVYILHGEKDDNVPVEQSLMMIDRIKGFHSDFEFHEQPDVGHWWDISPEPGTDCVDWRPMFDFFARHVRPGRERVRTVEFSTANPGISSTDAWVSIDAQERQLTVSSARLHVDPGLNRVVGTTDNVARLSLANDILNLSKDCSVELDSQRIAVRNAASPNARLWFERSSEKWRQSNLPSAFLKGAQRYGTFKDAFRNHMALVYATGGTRAENGWAFARARYDAEILWYRGNASVDVLADTEFVPSREPDRNVVLYGNSKTHRLWKSLLPDCPVHVDRDRVEYGGKTLKRADICCVFVHPRPHSDRACVGVVAGTGIEGMMLSSLARYLEPGLGLPDLTIFDSDLLTKGDAGIILAGFFGPDWSLTSGEFVTGR